MCSGRRRSGPFQSVSHASSVEASDAKGGVGRECLESAVQEHRQRPLEDLNASQHEWAAQCTPGLHRTKNMLPASVECKLRCCQLCLSVCLSVYMYVCIYVCIEHSYIICMAIFNCQSRVKLKLMFLISTTTLQCQMSPVLINKGKLPFSISCNHVFQSQ